MQRTAQSGMILGLLLLCGGVLFASEADELRERAKAMQKEASVLAERGNKEQAERLEREAGELLEAAERMELKAKGRGEQDDRPGIDKEVQRLRERLQDLLAKEKELREANASEKELAKVREQIAGTERELHAIHAHHAGQGKLPPEFHAQAEKLEAASRRIHHLRVAAENLKMAEAHDLAHQLMEKAEGMEREVQDGKKRLAAEVQKVHSQEHGPDVVRKLKEEIERLRAEVKELRQQVEKR
jgi:DNA repair exonuclease SbcCD ATPase subunit